ncbi:glycosyltransferase [Nocardiopsis alba]|uniref:glycosyltransferase n=1 Tax=Nocardiopsis alba TaxID=53437 RepID=UPI00366FE458
MTRPPRPWVIITDYPTWPSPYFHELHTHTPDLAPEFTPHLHTLHNRPGPPGVVNLHRLKRLYRDGAGARTVAAAEAMLISLRTLRAAGWRVVWTVHNLLPIDGAPPGEADRVATHGVLELADAVVTHTHADAHHLASLTLAPITVAGWGGLTPRPTSRPLPAHLAYMVGRMRAATSAVLVLGNLTDYKDLPATTRVFLEQTWRAHLFIAGPECTPGLITDLEHSIIGHEERVHLLAERVEAQDVPTLYAAADVALCSYRTDGPWEFFTRVLHPSSVGTALSFGVPVIAPDLPAIREMTDAHPRLLYPPREGPTTVFAALDEHPFPAPVDRDRQQGTARWRHIGAIYAHLAAELWENE